MLVKENTIPRKHVAARTPASNANRADEPANRRRRRILITGAVIGVLGLFFGVRYWMYASTHEDTDDAYVTGNTHQISSRVTGTVEQVLIDDNWHVTAGQPLLKLDPRDYEVALTEARGSYLQAKAQLVQATAQIPLVKDQLAQAQAQADSSKANSDYLERTFERNRQLFYQGKGVISKEDLDNAQSQAETNLATYKANVAAVTVVKENLKVAQAQQQAASAQVDAAQAQVQNAELQLSYCTIVAPVSGRIAQKTVQTGNRVSVGQALLAVVEDDVWILANLKETQLEKVRVGQLVDIKIDALPHYWFKGRVDSLQPGSGSNFALLPPDNATGNFIKIVQRVPVKILFDPESIKGVREKIVAGLSATPSIMRNLGGSVGTALLSTMITQREQFHDFRIGERVTAYNPYVQQFLTNQSVQNLRHSGDPVAALQQAYRMLQASVQTNSYVMAYSECFLALGVILLLGSAAIWLCKKTKVGAAAAAH